MECNQSHVQKTIETGALPGNDLSQHLAEAVIAIGAGGAVERINPAAERLLLISEADAFGRPCHEVVRSSLCQTACPKDRVLSSGDAVTSFDVELRSDGPDPRRVCILSSVVRDPGGAATSIVETIRDVTEIVRGIERQKAAAVMARQTAEWLSAVVDTIVEAVITSDTAIRITSFNRAAELLTGYSRDEVLGRSCKDVFSTGFCPLEETLAKATGLPGIETRMRAKGGRMLSVWLTTEMLRDNEGQAIGAIQLVRDRSALGGGAVPGDGRHQPPPLVGDSPVIHQLCRWIDQLASTDSTVLLTGESGTGKELVAEAIHFRSTRRDKPLIKVNSAALPETLLESELFGHLRGAFTGAVSDRAGRFELAHRGTLFLDEIGDLPLPLQAKLLRVLQDRCVERLGSGKPVPVDIRVIAATNRDLRQMVANQQFREDLYYRLAVIPVEVPPLRDRREDIPALIESIFAKLAARGLPVAAGVSSSAMATLMNHAWPGNVRELENALEYASIRSGVNRIEPAHLPPSIHAVRSSGRAAAHSEAERNRIRAALRPSSNAAEAAARLGISRATLFRRMKALDLKVSRGQSQESHR